MLEKIKKRRSSFFCKQLEMRTLLVLLLFPLFVAFYSEPAHAWTSYTEDGFPQPTVIGDDGTACPDVDFTPTDFGLTRRVVPCIKDTILYAANTFIGPLVTYMGSAISAACTLSIALLGGLMIAGRSTAAWRDSMVLAAKLGGVSYFVANICYTTSGSFALFPACLDILDELINDVISYVFSSETFSYADDCMSWWGGDGSDDAGTTMAIWDYVDCTIEIFLGGIMSAGGDPGASIQYGMLGFLLSCVISKGLGITIGLIGFYLVIQFMMAVIRAVYMFVSSYFGIALCMIVAPIFIPTILFRSTKSYFANWVRALISFIIQPVILTAYIGMLLSGFDYIIFTGPNSFSRALVGSAVDESDFLDEGGVGGWMLENNVYANESLAETAITNDPTQAMTPIDAPDYGVGGDLATTNQIDLTNQTFLQALGVEGGGSPTYLGMDIPVTAVDWDALAGEMGYGGDTQDYLLNVLQSAIMGFIVGYIFLQMLNVLPFLGAGLAMGSGIVGGISVSERAVAGNMAAPGSDAAKNLKTSWN